MAYQLDPIRPEDRAGTYAGDEAEEMPPARRRLLAPALALVVMAAFAGATVPLVYLTAGAGSLCLASVIIRFTRRMALKVSMAAVRIDASPEPTVKVKRSKIRSCGRRP